MSAHVHAHVYTHVYVHAHRWRYTRVGCSGTTSCLYTRLHTCPCTRLPGRYTRVGSSTDEFMNCIVLEGLDGIEEDHAVIERHNYIAITM